MSGFWALPSASAGSPSWKRGHGAAGEVVTGYPAPPCLPAPKGACTSSMASAVGGGAVAVYAIMFVFKQINLIIGEIRVSHLWLNPPTAGRNVYNPGYILDFISIS